MVNGEEIPDEQYENPLEEDYKKEAINTAASCGIWIAVFLGAVMWIIIALLSIIFN